MRKEKSDAVRVKFIYLYVPSLLFLHMSKYIDVHISIPEEIRTTFKNMHDKIVSDRLV